MSLSTKCQVMFKDVNIISFRTPKIDTIYGIDVSVYQRKIEWSKIDTTIKFAIIKASEGINRVDKRFKFNWDSCRITKGGYHFFRPQFSGEKQGKLFLSLITTDSGSIIPVIDVEYTPYWLGKKNRKKAIKNLSAMVEFLSNESGIDPIIYTSVGFWNKYIVPNYTFNNKIWIADFRNQGPPNIVWSIWQYTCRSRVSGIGPLVDKNITYNIDTLLVK